MTSWSELPFGKHVGLTLPQVLFFDPGWYFWAMSEKAFRGLLAYEAARLLPRATRIRIPVAGMVVEYATHPSGGLGSVNLVPESAEAGQGGSASYTRPYIDLSVPTQLSSFDKTGDKFMVDFLKITYFGSTSYKMTRERCAEFFEDPAHFLL